MSFDLTPFQGVYPAGMTFFDADGELDEAATRGHWRWLVERGADGLVIGGTSGEFIALSDAEIARVFAWAADEVGDLVPLIFGSGHASTKITLERSRHAQELGADALIVILPYYCRPTKAAVLKHYRTLRDATDLPIMLYNNPANTACAALSPEDIAGLVEEDVVHMVKSTMESVVPIHDLHYMVGDRMRIFYGSFLSAFEAFAAGAHGWVSGVLNIVTEEARAMVAAVSASQLSAARAHWSRILPIVHLYTYQKLGPVADIPIYRAILNEWGRAGGYSREPFSPLDQTQIAALRGILEQTGWTTPVAAEADSAF